MHSKDRTFEELMGRQGHGGAGFFYLDQLYAIFMDWTVVLTFPDANYSVDPVRLEFVTTDLP
jgi:hypothetical protein